MTFAWPLALLGLVAVAAVLAVYLIADRRRDRDAARFGSPPLVRGLVAERPGPRRHVPFALLLAALTAIAVGAARPHATISVAREEATVVLAVDTSRSMAAEDLVPSRLAVAQGAARAFLDRLPESYRVAIVAFSSSAQIVLPPTADRAAASDALAELRLGSGTALGDAVVRAVDVARPRPVPAGPGQTAPAGDPVPATIVILSDGAQTAGRTEPDTAAALAARAGVPVNTVALGTGPAVVEVPLPGGLRERVTVEPDPDTLRTLALRTHGRFYEAPDADSLQEVYAELGSRLGREDTQREMTQVFAAAGGLVLLTAGALSMVWFRRAM
jgi:Ca-activated chloride channel family protein